MVEKSKKSKKASISEADVSTLLERYSATTVLALLKEVAQVSDAKIDWNVLVRNSATGISSAREYQMLWRHLAYGHALLQKLEVGAEPLDDDSDLECDLEASPTPSCETSAEAAACVKVLIASVLPSDSSVQNGSTIEAPLMINIPNAKPNRNVSEGSQLGYSMQGTNITVPVVVQKLPIPSVTPAVEQLETNGSTSSSLPYRKKRKPWSEEEDMELIAAVEKFGEGNWANILKGEFKSDRTASQLSQRWATIRKRRKNSNQGSILRSSKPPNSDGSKHSEAMLAAHRAMSMALDTPKPNFAAGQTNSNISSKQPVRGSTSQPQPQPVSTPPNSRAPALGLNSQPQAVVKKSTPTSYNPDSTVKAAAVAAGARIASQNDAASLIKSENPVHIMDPGGSLIKSSLPGGLSNQASSIAHTNIKHVHPTLPISPKCASGTNGNHVHDHSTKVVPSSAACSPPQSPEQTNLASDPIIESSSTKEIEASVTPVSDLITQPPSTKEMETSASTDIADLITQTSSAMEIEASTSTDIAVEQVQEIYPPGSSNSPNEQLQEDQKSAANIEAPHCSPVAVDEKLNCLSDMEIDGGSKKVATTDQNADNLDANDSRMMELSAKKPSESGCEEMQESPAKKPGESNCEEMRECLAKKPGDSQCEMEEDSKNANQNEKEVNILNMAMEEDTEKVEAVKKPSTLNDTSHNG